MEEVGTQVAAPLFIHQSMPGRFHEAGLIGKKRSLCYSASNQKNQNSQVEHVADGWNPKDWEWDSARFVARVRPPEQLSIPNVVSLGNCEGNVVEVVEQGCTVSKSGNSRDECEQNGNGNGNGPRLQLGDASTSSSKTGSGNEEPPTSSRPNKKGRSGSPGSGGNYPMCQVDDCKEDLSKSKDYHRRHKVCVLHSKATETVVGKQLQRFCQQCSRFHPLSEFDDGKRSCRRRLAGHNRRRRKTQPEDAKSPVVHPTDSNNGGNVNLNIVNLLTVLAHGPGIAEKSISNSSPLPDKNQLIEILSTLNAISRATNLPPSHDTPSTKNIFKQSSLGENNMHVNPVAEPNLDCLAAHSATFVGSPVAFESLRQRTAKDTGSNICNKPTIELSSSTNQTPTASDGQVQDTEKFLPLQLFSPSPGDDSPPNTVSSHKYFSSDSCSPSDERSHSSSVPITRIFFPLETTSEIDKPDRMSICEEANLNVEAIKSGTFSSGMTLDLFGLGNRDVSNSLQSLPYQGGYTSSSGSDHSPPSFNSDPQKNRTGRIRFKLFAEDPGHIPGALRSQINFWLSNHPSDMESFIRPGCVVLSIYVSMSSTAWEKVEENFAQLVSNLIQGSDTEFWRSGRFSVNIGRQLAFHKDGKVNFCKPGSPPNSPELVVVSPLAVVSGQSTSLVIKGRNLTSPGTKIHCAYMGRYSSKQVFESTYQGLTHDEIRLSNFKVQAPTSVLGRCFIEVENGDRGNSFPIIIADAKICQELRLLEHEFDKGVIRDDHTQNMSSPSSDDEILCFLNELGWLFQIQSSSDVANHEFSLDRFRYLFTFSIERDYCALVKTVLDIYVENGSRKDGLSTECIEALDKMHLLHRAVKKRSKRMVDMLIHYSAPVGKGASKRYVFPPNTRGPGGITPLHLAACTSCSYDIVNILTDDSMEIGLHSWKSLLDDNGQSPSAYAMMRNDHSLNSLVTRKLIDKANSQVSLSIENEIVDSLEHAEVKQRSSLQINKIPDPCSKCAMTTYSRMPGSHGMLHRPFIHSMLAIAAVCVCVCLFFKSMAVQLTWGNLHFGSI